jgi:hypothetical protein
MGLLGPRHYGFARVGIAKNQPYIGVCSGVQPALFNQPGSSWKKSGSKAIPKAYLRKLM